MQTAILKSDSKEDLKVLAVIAKKMGIRFKMLTEEEVEDIGMFNAMKERTGKKVNVDSYLKKLRSK